MNTIPIVIHQTVDVIDQYGKPLDFYRDLVKGNRVAINFIYTRCTSSCLLSSLIFQRTQNRLNDKSVQFISITLDPTADNPEQLRAYAEKFHAPSNWHFITGKPTTLTQLLNALGAYSLDLNNHTNMVLVGNDKNHKWLRLYGLPSVDDIAAAINDVR